MTGSLMQLVAYGVQDTYLTGSPQITLFKLIYRRHTNFVIECIETPIETAKLGGKSQVKIERNGDLLSKSYLRLELPDLIPNNSQDYNGKVAWIKRLGHFIINSIEISIGGSVIDKQYGLWLDIWYELTHKESISTGYEKMIGNVEELTKLSSSIPGGYNIYIPLQFWFCSSYGMALPASALQYHEIVVSIQYENLQNLYVYTRGNLKSNQPQFNNNLLLGSSGLLIDWVYLDFEERKRMSQASHEYLIDQVQKSPEFNFKDTTINNNIQFNHPCREFVWVNRLNIWNNKPFKTSSDYSFLGYASNNGNDTWDKALDEVADELVKSSILGCVEYQADTNLLSASVNALGYDSNSGLDFAIVMPADGEAVPSKIVLNGITIDISSSIILNGNDTLIKLFIHDPEIFTILNIKLINRPKTPKLLIFSKSPVVITDSVSKNNISMLSFIESASVDLYFTTDKVVENVSLFSSHVDKHSLNIDVISLPIDNKTVCDYRKDSYKSNCVKIQNPSNYGLKIDGSYNILVKSNINLNSQDRFAIREGQYFNYVQPYQHHSRTPADGVNTYSFALRPEEHQPSGTINMSRIDNTRLFQIIGFKASDNLMKRKFVELMEGETSIFARNINVLRIVSGMGGIAYTN